MSKSKRKTPTEMMEQFRISLENAVNQTEISKTLAVFGYTADEIAKGKAIYDEAKQAFNFNSQENNETIAARNDYDSAKDLVVERYSLDRKKAKVIFKEDDVVLKQLSLTGLLPVAHVDWINTVKAFYEGVSADESLQTKLARLAINPADIKAALVDIENMENARSFYYKEVGESEDATKQKDQAYSKIDKWMREFYAVAKIAMEDQPQLLEALGVFVRS